MESVNAEALVEVLCECPYCGYGMDIMDNSEIYSLIQENLHHSNIDIEITCEECKKEFIVKHIS